MKSIREIAEEIAWRCACGWHGTPSQMTVSNDLRTCPDCGGSGGLILDALEPAHKSAIAEIFTGVCTVGPMDCSLADFARGVKVYIEDESQSVRCDTHLIALLQRAACLAWENERLFRSSPIPTTAPPSTPAAIRAAAEKGEPAHPLIVRDHYHVDTLGHIAKRRCSCSLNAPPHRFVCAVCVESERHATPAAPSPRVPEQSVERPTPGIVDDDFRFDCGLDER